MVREKGTNGPEVPPSMDIQYLGSSNKVIAAAIAWLSSGLSSNLDNPGSRMRKIKIPNKKQKNGGENRKERKPFLWYFFPAWTE